MGCIDRHLREITLVCKISLPWGKRRGRGARQGCSRFGNTGLFLSYFHALYLVLCNVIRQYFHGKHIFLAEGGRNPCEAVCREPESPSIRESILNLFLKIQNGCPNTRLFRLQTSPSTHRPTFQQDRKCKHGVFDRVRMDGTMLRW